jgi:hypothetical protein
MHINAGSVDIYFSIFIGAGRTGAVSGASDITSDFAIGFHSSSPLTINSYSPTTVSSAIPVITYNVDNIGPVPSAPFNVEAMLYAYDPMSSPFACITSTAACGNIHQKKLSFAVNLNIVPDSIRLFGIEGAGNPIGGCYPDPDMLLSLTSLLPVQLGGFYVQLINNTALLNWSTHTETNADYFLIQKSYDAENFETIGSVKASGTSTNKKYYSYTDTDYLYIADEDKTPYYRIVQYDFEGNSYVSKVITLNYHTKKSGSPIVYPNPSSDILNIRFKTDYNTTVTIRDIMGRQIFISTILENGTLTIDVSAFPKGICFIEIKNDKESYSSKIILE